MMDPNLKIAFSEGGLMALNVAIALIMFGVALSIDASHFRLLVRKPKPVLVGAISQFAVLPALTAGLIFLWQPDPGLGMGMLMVASCPGGSVSNFFSMVGKGNVALSVTLSALSTMLAALLTPLNFYLWMLAIYGQDFAREFELSFFDLLQTLAIILLIPVTTGLLFKWKFPRTAARVLPWFQNGSFLVLLAIIAVAFWGNRGLFLDYIGTIFMLVLVHNTVALASGYYWARLWKLSVQNCRTISLETGIQNSGLGLIIIFSFFDGNGAMSFVAAWWGIWHIISGGSLAYHWRKRGRIQSRVK